jgi:glyceraldehyde-3-phosphate dehydrogenase/erythrose-4-phosphate dehydrogenase
MSLFTDTRKQMDALEADIVTIRRQIEDGSSADLLDLPKRVEAMCANITALAAQDAKALATDMSRLVGLMDALTKDVTTQYTRIRSAFERLQQRTANDPNSAD